jgi:hypothetical protein
MCSKPSYGTFGSVMSRDLAHLLQTILDSQNEFDIHGTVHC